MNAIQHSNGQDNINVNEISESLTSASSAPARRTRRRSFPLLVIKTQKILLLRYPDSPGRTLSRSFRKTTPPQSICFRANRLGVYSCGTCRRKKHRESLFLKKSELRKDWRSVLSRRFSSSIKTTNVNTEEIFSVHSTFFFLVQKKILLVLVLGRHQHREEEEQFRSKKWLSEHCSLVFDRQDTKHQLTFPDFTSTILEHPDYWRRRKTMKSSEDSSSLICTAYE